MTLNVFIPALVGARAGRVIRSNLPPRQPAQAAPRRPHRPATWHLGSRGVWKERRIKTRPA